MKHTQKERELKDLKKKNFFISLWVSFTCEAEGVLQEEKSGSFSAIFFFKEMVSAGPPKMAYNLQGRFNQTVNQNETPKF